MISDTRPQGVSVPHGTLRSAAGTNWQRGCVEDDSNGVTAIALRRKMLLIPNCIIDMRRRRSRLSSLREGNCGGIAKEQTILDMAECGVVLFVVLVAGIAAGAAGEGLVHRSQQAGQGDARRCGAVGGGHGQDSADHQGRGEEQGLGNRGKALCGHQQPGEQGPAAGATGSAGDCGAGGRAAGATGRRRGQCGHLRGQHRAGQGERRRARPAHVQGHAGPQPGDAEGGHREPAGAGRRQQGLPGRADPARSAPRRRSAWIRPG